MEDHRPPGVTIQLAIPGLANDRLRASPKRPAEKAAGRPSHVGRDPLLEVFLRRLAHCGFAPKSVWGYGYQLRWMLRTAACRRGRTVGLGELFCDEGLLGSVLVDDADAATGRVLSKWTLAQRRSAARCFAGLMRPEVLDILGGCPHQALDRAQRGVAQRVGGGYRASRGAPHAGRPVCRRERTSPRHRPRGAPSGVSRPPEPAFVRILGLAPLRSAVDALRRLDGRRLCASSQIRPAAAPPHEKGTHTERRGRSY
jgi:hypothetical protein